MLSLRRGAVITATCVLALSAGAPARAMTGGSPDSSHPSVGMLMPRPDNGKFCGGTLITPTVFLTAGHCVAGRLGLGATTWSVSFSADPLAAPGTLSTGRLVLDPAYRANDGNAANDLGAVVFPTPVEGVNPTPVAQPLTSSWLASASLELVGYGYTEARHGAGGTTYSGRGTRYGGSTGLQALADEWTTTSGGASACDGDSGGALFANGALAGVSARAHRPAPDGRGPRVSTRPPPGSSSPRSDPRRGPSAPWPLAAALAQPWRGSGHRGLTSREPPTTRPSLEVHGRGRCGLSPERQARPYPLPLRVRWAKATTLST